MAKGKPKSIPAFEQEVRRGIAFYAQEHPMGVLKVLAELVEKNAAREGYADNPLVQHAILKIREAEEAFRPIYER
jgi:hypothetical protein